MTDSRGRQHDRADPTDRPEFQPEPVNVEDAIRKALTARTDVAIAKKNVEANNLTLSYLRNQTLPTLDLQLLYGLQGIGGDQLIRSNDFGGSTTTIVPGSITDSFASLFHNRYPRWNVAINMSYPLGTSTQSRGS